MYNGGLRPDRRRDSGNAGHVFEGDYDLAGFAVGIVEKDSIIDQSRVSSNDVLIGFIHLAHIQMAIL